MDIYEEIAAALRAGERMALATIISSTGSTPVPPGAKMLVKAGAAIPLGTVGGGCVEGDVLTEARRVLGGGKKSLIRKFTLTEDNIESGMLCGGTIDLLIEELSRHESSLYTKLLLFRQGGRDSALVTLIGPDEIVQGKFLISPQASGLAAETLSQLRGAAGELPPSFEEILRGALARETLARIPVERGEFIVEPVTGFQDLILFGGGHVSKYVSRSATMAGFRVTVVDDRPEYANAQRFPEAHRTLATGFDASWDELAVKQATSIVIVTRGHKFDEHILERAVRTEARYVGMIGSRRKVIATFENLIRRGIPADLLRRVHAPIGLAIGALTAEEIGVSITAELIAARRGVISPGGSLADRVAEFFEGTVKGPENG